MHKVLDRDEIIGREREGEGGEGEEMRRAAFINFASEGRFKKIDSENFYSGIYRFYVARCVRRARSSLSDKIIKFARRVQRLIESLWKALRLART